MLLLISNFHSKCWNAWKVLKNVTDISFFNRDPCNLYKKIWSYNLLIWIIFLIIWLLTWTILPHYIDMQVLFLHISYHWLALNQNVFSNNMITSVVNPKLERWSVNTPEIQRLSYNWTYLSWFSSQLFHWNHYTGLGYALG